MDLFGTLLLSLVIFAIVIVGIAFGVTLGAMNFFQARMDKQDATHMAALKAQEARYEMLMKAQETRYEAALEKLRGELDDERRARLEFQGQVKYLVEHSPGSLHVDAKGDLNIGGDLAGGNKETKNR